MNVRSENCDKLLADELSKWKIERRRTRRKKKKNKSDGEERAKGKEGWKNREERCECGKDLRE